jgi:hypothetical protein
VNSRHGFASTFEALTGYRPFPWQEALFDRFVADSVPASCSLPTIGRGRRTRRGRLLFTGNGVEFKEITHDASC